MWRLLSIKCLCNHMTTLLTCSMSRTLLLPFWDVFEYQFFCLTIFCWCPNLAGLGPTLLKVQIFEKSAKNPTLIKINFVSNDFSIKSNFGLFPPKKVQFLSNYFLIDHQSQRKSIQYQRIATWRKTVAEQYICSIENGQFRFSPEVQ